MEKQRIVIYPGPDSIITKLRKLGVQDRGDFVFSIDKTHGEDAEYKRTDEQSALKTKGKRKKA